MSEQAKPKLHVIIASTRPARIGPKVADWLWPIAEAHGGFALERVDLKEVALPMFDEPKHPRLGDYAHAHTKAWSAVVARADAFVFVTPEYNHAAPPALVNALDYLSKEWAYKPVGLVSYGGASGGLRSAQVIKLMCGALKMVPLFESVSLPFVAKMMKDDRLEVHPDVEKSARVMLDELVRWTGALKTLRA